MTLPFTWREVNELHALVTEPLDLLELLPTPQCDTSLMECSEISALGRPAHVGFGPALQTGMRQEEKQGQLFSHEVNVEAKYST